jgi:hypothetical protein
MRTQCRLVTGPTTRWRVRTLVAAVTILPVAGAAACGGDAGRDSATASTASALGPGGDGATTTSAPPAPEDEAVAAYRGAYGAYLAALDPPDPLAPDLPELFGGEALGTIIDAVLSARDQGVRVDASMEMNPTVVSATGGEVVLEDCVVETNTVYDAATGEPTDSGTYVNHRRVTVVNHDGSWVVEAFERLEAPCTPAAG